MAHEPILKVRLLPPDVPVFCSSCSKFDATHWLCDPVDHAAIIAVCLKHGQELLRVYKEQLKPPESWTLEPIHHSDPADRTSHARGPICGHQTCSQVFIDTGENVCGEVQR
jgi:hypothetical protein